MVQINERLDKHIGQGEEAYYDQKDNVYHISSIGKCPRFIFLERTERRPDTVKNKRIFILGKLIHEWTQDTLFNDYIKEEQISYIKNGVTFIGRMDLHNNDEVVELKSCGNMAYLVEPHEEHKVQLNTYMGIKGIKKGQIIYISKQDFETVSFDVNFSQELFDTSINSIIKLNEQIKKKADYKGIGQIFSNNCKYCKYKDLCGMDNGEQSSLSDKKGYFKKDKKW